MFRFDVFFRNSFLLPSIGYIFGSVDMTPRLKMQVIAFGHGLRTPNEGISQRNLKIWADVADKICFGRT